MRHKILLITTIYLLLCLYGIARADTVLRCASTTSTQNSGLFDHILPVFEKKTGIKVHVVAAGTGASLEMGRRGDADIVFVHSRDDELRMVREGWFVDRHDVMYNDFVVVGPAEDPAGLTGLKDALSAFRNINKSNAQFVSRGDSSGTHKKELYIWHKAGIDPKGKAWYLEIGQGMAKTLRIANEKGAYTLTDRGTYLSLKDRERLFLRILLEGDPVLVNQYGVMAVNPERHPHVRYKEALEFINWLTSEEGQSLIASFKDAYGNQLFYPNALK